MTFTTKLNCALSLRHLCKHLINFEYKSNNKFKHIVYKSKKTRVTILIYASGSLVLTGAKSVEAVRPAAREIGRKIQKLGYNVKLSAIKTCNIAASYDF